VLAGDDKRGAGRNPAIAVRHDRRRQQGGDRRARVLVSDPLRASSATTDAVSARRAGSGRSPAHRRLVAGRRRRRGVPAQFRNRLHLADGSWSVGADPAGIPAGPATDLVRQPLPANPGWLVVLTGRTDSVLSRSRHGVVRRCNRGVRGGQPSHAGARGDRPVLVRGPRGDGQPAWRLDLDRHPGAAGRRRLVDDRRRDRRQGQHRRL
jgi:hypothetical protein